MGIGPTRAQLQTDQIRILYEEPKKADYRPLSQRLQQRRVLETLQQFLSPLKLPRPFTVKTGECGGDPFAPYKPGAPATICYEFVSLLEKLQPGTQYPYWYIGKSEILVTRNMALVGPFVQEALHDVALGAFDMLEIPVWGRAEDAADHVAAFLMLQFGTDVARKTVLGTAYFLDIVDNIVIRNNGNLLPYDLAYIGGIRPTVRQRYYNILCIAVGGDPIGFSEFLPLKRTGTTMEDVPLDRGCLNGGEYAQVKDAFVKTILDPYVDAELLKKVKAAPWLKDD
jgi:hypothetical protein